MKRRASIRRGFKGAAVLIAVFITGCSTTHAGADDPAPASTGVEAKVPRTISAPGTSDPLMGTWDSGPHSLKQVVAAIVKHGRSRSEAEDFFAGVGLGNATMFEMNLQFYTDGGQPYVTVAGWDPTTGSVPSDGDHGPYAFLPGGRVAFTSADPAENKDKDVFSFKVAGRQLILQPRGLTNPDKSPAQLRRDAMLLFVIAAEPLTKSS
jgi:hypothetical protein